MNRAIVVVLALLGGAVISHQVLYNRLLVPRLSGMHSVPWWVWLVVLSPIWLTGVVGGAHVNSWRRNAIVAILAALGMGVYETWAARAGQPGFWKSQAVEAPAEFWTVHVAITTVLIVTVLAIGMLAGSAWRRWR